MQTSIPTNLITGFLGVGKTTAILHLLQQKPLEEKWAVLVNEFGEIGIDGAMLEGRGAFIKEIPGGCICCVAGVPLQVGLNQLLGVAKPARLLIEPTGLGHPQNIIDMLAGEYYRNVLELRATLCLVDARKVAEPRYREHATFRDQLRLADAIIANKTDLSSAEQQQTLREYLQTFTPPRIVDAAVTQGAIPLELLDRPHAQRTPQHHHHHEHSGEKLFLPLQLPPGETFLRRENHGLEHVSCGWLFAAEQRFEFGRLFMLFSGISADRLKAVMNTERGAFIFNAENGVLSVHDAPGEGLSRIEIIHRETLSWDALEHLLLTARIEPATATP